MRTSASQMYGEGPGRPPTCPVSTPAKLGLKAPPVSWSMQRALARPCVVGLAMLSLARAASAFVVAPAHAGGGCAAARVLGRGALACTRGTHAALPLAASRPMQRAGFRTGLFLAADDAGGLGDKNITVGPDGINFDDVGAVVNLRMGGQGFKAPEKKPGPDVGVNFKVKSKTQLAKEIDQNTAKQNNAGSAYNLDNLVEFPCLFQLKVLGHRQGEFVEDILDLIGNTLGTAPVCVCSHLHRVSSVVARLPVALASSPAAALDARAGINGRELKHSHRDKGKWRSITIAVPVDSADQL